MADGGVGYHWRRYARSYWLSYCHQSPVCRKVRGFSLESNQCFVGFQSKYTGVGCHFLLQCMKVKSESEVAQLCPTCSDPMDCSLPGSSIHGIFQARVLEWGAIAFSDTASRSDFNAHILLTAPQCLSLGLCIASASTFLPFLLPILPLPIPKHWSFYFGSNFAYIHPLCNLMYRQSFHLPCTQMVSKSKYQAQLSSNQIFMSSFLPDSHLNG